MIERTLRKVARYVSVCGLCGYEQAYKDGDEDRRCPACGGPPISYSGDQGLTARLVFATL